MSREPDTLRELASVMLSKALLVLALPLSLSRPLLLCPIDDGDKVVGGSVHLIVASIGIVGGSGSGGGNVGSVEVEVNAGLIVPGIVVWCRESLVVGSKLAVDLLKPGYEFLVDGLLTHLSLRAVLLSDETLIDWNIIGESILVCLHVPVRGQSCDLNADDP